VSRGLIIALCALVLVVTGSVVAWSAGRIENTSGREGSAGSTGSPDYFSATFEPGQAIVSLRFDDGAQADWDLVYPLLVERGLKASFAVPYDEIGAPGSLSLSQMRRLEAEGNEIVCHSMTHGSEPTSFADFKNETAGAKAAMEALGFTITSFSIPGTWGEGSKYIAWDSSFWGTPADLLLRQHFYAYEGFVQDIPGGGTYRALPVTGDIPYGYAHFEEGGIPQIDEAISRGDGIQLLWHSRDIGRAGHQSVAQFTSILDHVAAKVAAGKVVVLTDTEQLYAVATAKAKAGLTLETSHRVVRWGGSAALTGALTDGAEAFTAGQKARLQRSTNGSVWTLLQVLDPSAAFTYSAAVQPRRKTMYRLVFPGDAAHSGATSPRVTVTPSVKLGKPVAPGTVSRNVRFTSYGSLVPSAPAGSHSVRIRCYRRQSGIWVRIKTVVATNRDYSTYSRYSAGFTLPSRGDWKLTAYAPATSRYAAASSNAEFLMVK
jgi:peptidoglycan/xylan/chitin deacetylase (PgdA/CDA1 family)